MFRSIGSVGQVFSVLLLGVLWGVNWPVVKVILTEVPPLTIRAIAFPAAAILLAIVVKTRRAPLLPARRDILPIAITGAFIIFGFNVLATFGQTLTEASKAAIIAYTMPAITGVLAALFIGEAFTQRSVLALVIGMGGLGVLASEDLAALIADPRGAGIMVAAALSWSVGNVLLKARQWSVPPLSLTVWFFAVSTLICWPLVLWFEPPSQTPWPSPMICFAMIYHVCGPMVICYAIWTTMVDRLPATVAAIGALSAPVFGVLSSALLIGEALTWQKLLALAMIVLSVALTFSRPQTARAESP